MSDGWHDDPFGRYAKRYWDGTSWTQYVSNTGETAVDPLGVEPSPPGFQKAAPVSAYDQPKRRVEGFDATPGSPGMRLLARIIDSLVVGLPAWYLVLQLFDIEIDFENLQDLAIPWEAIATISGLTFVYETLLIGATGRTIGKMICGLTVVHRTDLGVPGFGLAAVRAGAYAVLYSIPGIGFIILIATIVMAFVTPLRQTIHDRAASTVVVRTSTL
jgi:uncharacterized RDD family membrane protein YckC